MKKFFKWIAICVGVFILLALFFDQDIESRRWLMLGAGLGYAFYFLNNTLDRIEQIVREIRYRLD